uniref:Uncharacterized protein n=1 Tax=Psilotum nudum TaxID=3240 RepID=Q8W842_PSINU|nr:hypothetical protein PsnuCp071 [Psilotum nudum]NP_569702.1 hypothetical protein PsnuCp097 [Psilotum nudum]BAB84265.1 hypothetical protein [Psilotum nudum]BAB84291.1 hypothetical protein [Psilotum nudum]
MGILFYHHFDCLLTLPRVRTFALGLIMGEEGFEPPTPWFVATCSDPLSYKPHLRGICSRSFLQKQSFLSPAIPGRCGTPIGEILRFIET